MSNEQPFQLAPFTALPPTPPQTAATVVVTQPAVATLGNQATAASAARVAAALASQNIKRSV